MAISKHVLFNIPNLLSIFRMLLVPLLVVILLTKFEGKEFVGLGVFLLASLTDFLDGYIARKKQQVTRLGKFLDPTADKILTSAAFISLVEMGLAPAWMVVVIIAREFAVSALRSLAASDNVIVAAIFSAKLKTTLQIVAIALMIISNQLGEFERLAPVALWLAMLASVYSGLEYFFRFGPDVFRARTRQQPSPLPSNRKWKAHCCSASRCFPDAGTGASSWLRHSWSVFPSILQVG